MPAIDHQRAFTIPKTVGQIPAKSRVMAEMEAESIEQRREFDKRVDRLAKGMNLKTPLKGGLD